MNKKTKRLFDVDPYQVQFVADVLAQEQISPTEWRVLLDKTAFYPESGGQPYDVGMINDSEVIKVFEEDGFIYHHITSPLTEQKVEGKVDFNKRFDHMQQHSGQHILSAACKKLFGIETVAFHLGKEESTIDLKVADLPRESLDKIEYVTNSIIQENRPIEARFFQREEVEIHFLQKVPSDQTVIRMVHISDFDLSACCGTHPFRTGEIGLIKIVHTEKYKGMIRLSFVCGQRALRRVQAEHHLLQEVCRKLKTNQEQLASKLTLSLEELAEIKKLSRGYYQRMLKFEAEQMVKYESFYLGELQVDFYFLKTDQRNIQELKDLAKTLIEKEHRFVLFVYGSPDHLQQQWILAMSDSIPLSIKGMIQNLIDKYEGKGGGSNVFGQWTGDFPAGEELTFIQKLLKV